jgi:nucleotide-binding universal stress UspA family protein
MYDTILVPTDGSEHADAAIERALDLAERYGATLHALFVVDTSYPYADFETPPVNWSAVTDAMEGQGEAATATVRERADERGVSIETEVRQATSVHRMILDYADEHDVDLIVMGTRGRKGLDRYLLGSVTEKVVRLSDVPVLTVKAPKAEE